MSNNLDRYISVFIPTFNGDKYLAECIEAILNQKLPNGYKLELLVIDSGSIDKTMDILRSFEDRLSLLEIPNSEFSHGGTRNKAARLTKGEFILFLSQDATPANQRWLINMIEPFFLNDLVGCVFGNQRPRLNAAATIKREVSSVFGSMGTSDSIVIQRKKSLIDHKNTNKINTFFSDVNSAVRRSLLVGEIPFRDVTYAEDQALAKDMQEHGYLKAYAPLGEVWHSNEYTISEYYKRKFDEYIGLQESTNLLLIPSKKSLLLGWIKPTLADYKFIYHDREYSSKSKLMWFSKSPIYNMAMRLGKYHAAKHINNKDARKKISLESGRRG